jgi:hypothetical protein
MPRESKSGDWPTKAPQPVKGSNSTWFVPDQLRPCPSAVSPPPPCCAQGACVRAHAHTHARILAARALSVTARSRVGAVALVLTVPGAWFRMNLGWRRMGDAEARHRLAALQPRP